MYMVSYCRRAYGFHARSLLAKILSFHGLGAICFLSKLCTVYSAMTGCVMLEAHRELPEIRRDPAGSICQWLLVWQRQLGQAFPVHWLQLGY